MAHILVIEDNNEIHELIKEALSKNYQVTGAFSGTEGKLLIEMKEFDLILLDLMLPGLSGEELLPFIKEKTQAPVIVMSAKDAIDTKVDLLSSGANDYLVKPFAIKELIARIEVQLKLHQRVRHTSLYKIGLMTYDEPNHTLTYDNQELPFTRLEQRIVIQFIKNPKKIFTKQEVFENAWEDYYIGEDKTINVHMSNIRRKLQELTGYDWIQTVWGVGFRLNPERLLD